MTEYELVKAPYWSQYPYYFRKKPDRSNPSVAEACNRLRFGEAAYAAYGSKMKEGDELPPAAVAVQNTRGTDVCEVLEPCCPEGDLVKEIPLSFQIAKRLFMLRQMASVKRKERREVIPPIKV